jgi:adhesin transport system outer membrane protein
MKKGFLAVLPFLIFCSHGHAVTSLPEAIKSSLHIYEEVKQGEYDVNASRAALHESYFGFFPDINLKANVGSEYTKNQNTAGGLNGDSTNYWGNSYSANIHQNLFGEGRYYDAKFSQANLKAVKHSYQNVRNRISFATSEAYINVLRFNLLVETYKENLKYHEVILKKIKKRINAGIGKGSEVVLTESRLLFAKQNLQSAKSELEVANTIFKRFVGIEVPDISTLKIPKMPNAFLPKSFDDAWEKAMVNNPDLAAVKNDIFANKAAYKKTFVNAMPSVSLDLNASKDDDRSNILGQDDGVSALINVSYSFNPGAQIGRVANAKWVYKRSRERFKLANRDLFHSLHEIFIGYENNKKIIEFSALNQTYTKKIVESYNKEFGVGHRSLFDLLNAQTENYNAKISYLNAKYDQYINAYNILFNVGNIAEIVNGE